MGSIPEKSKIIDLVSIIAFYARQIRKGLLIFDAFSERKGIAEEKEARRRYGRIRFERRSDAKSMFIKRVCHLVKKTALEPSRFRETGPLMVSVS